MSDMFTRRQRTKIMSSIRGKDTKPELVVRRLLHGAGYRFRIHVKTLPGKPDLYFSSRAKAVFVNGCFWHGHEKCRKGTTRPKTNRHFWQKKIHENVRRDREKRKELAELGIKSFVVWECDLSRTDEVVSALKQFLGAPKHA